MCNLNIVIKKKGIDITSGLNFATAHSFVSNDDGDGAYFSGVRRLVKGIGKIDLTRYREEIKKSEFVITHQRLASRGFSSINIQPFANNHFVFVHNGTLRIKRKCSISGRSDSFVFFKDFIQSFRKLEDVKKAIESTMNTIVIGGSYSIFLYDKEESVGYYFKNKDKKISIARLKNNALFITTDEKNFVFFEVTGRYRVNNNVLYSFKVDRARGILDKIGKLNVRDVHG